MDAKLLPILLLFVLRRVVSECTTGFVPTCDKLIDAKNCADWRRLLLKGDGVRYEKVGARSFEKCPNLKQVYIVDSTNRIDAHAFGGSRLENLELEGNRLKNVAKNAFGGFVGLKKLSLSANGIEDIAAGAFEFSTIDDLDLSNNNLSRLGAEVNVAGLATLVVKNNSLTRLDAGCFGDDLRRVDLSVNRLEVIDVAVFGNLHKLQSLNLAVNEIRHVVRVPRMSQLTDMDLSKNRIVSMASDAFVDLPELRRLNLGYNKLVNVFGSVFPVRSKITSMYLHWNYLSGLFHNFGANLGNLKDVTLGGNPWACRCLQEIQRFLKTYNVGSPACDNDFFSNGVSPICINDDVRSCNGSHVSGDENDAMAFRRTIQKYDC